MKSLFLLLPLFFSNQCLAVIKGYALNIGTITFDKSYWDVGGWVYVSDNLGGNPVLWNTDTETANTISVGWTYQYTSYISLTNCPPTGMSCIAVETPVKGLYMAFSFLLTYPSAGWVSGVGTPNQLVTVNSITKNDSGEGAITYAKMAGTGADIILAEAYYSFYQSGSSLQTTTGTNISLTNEQGKLQGVGLYMQELDDKHRDNIYIGTGTIIVNPETCGVVGDNYNLTVNMDSVNLVKLYELQGIYTDFKGTASIGIECIAGLTPTVSFKAKTIETDNSGVQTLIGLTNDSTAEGVAYQLKSDSISNNALDITGATSYNFAGNALATTKGESRTMDLNFYYYRKSGIELSAGTANAILDVNLKYK